MYQKIKIYIFFLFKKKEYLQSMLHGIIRKFEYNIQ